MEMLGPVFWSQTTLGAISAWSCRDFARILGDFVQVFRDFARIFGDFVQVFRDFARIFGDFVQVFRDFARIFDKAKTLGVRLHPPPPAPLSSTIVLLNMKEN